jgi:hypothetical protein
MEVFRDFREDSGDGGAKRQAADVSRRGAPKQKGFITKFFKIQKQIDYNK